MKPITISLMLLSCCLWAVPQLHAEDKQPPPLDMKQKLVLSQDILSGLATEDFDQVLKSAKALNAFAKHKAITTESWQYRTQNQLFWFTTGNLALSAREKNLDGATLAYTQMTLSCVNCHKLLRHQ